MNNTIIKPKKPRGEGWVRLVPPPAWVSLGYDCDAWQYKDICVFSAVEVAKDADNIERGPEYHISISLHTQHGPVRCDSNTAKWVIDQFDCDGAEEDNHVPNGVVRNFWLPVNQNLIGMECTCKDKEPAIKENKGDYIWRHAE